MFSKKIEGVGLILKKEIVFEKVEYDKINVIEKMCWIAGRRWEEVDTHDNSNSIMITYPDVPFRIDPTLNYYMYENIDFFNL